MKLLIVSDIHGSGYYANKLLEIVENKLNKNYQIIWAPGPKQYDIIKEQLKKSINNNQLNSI